MAKEGWSRKFDMFYVYLIRSEAFPTQRYIGFTADLKERIKTHNVGGSVHTSKYKPWELICYHAFSDKRKAQEFEYYLKSGSGKAFAKRRFW
jgi:predicted GIY-YIG superfamily endonuclease